MAAYLIVHITVKDPDKMAEYLTKVRPLIAEVGGEFTIRANVTEVLEGSHDHKRCVVIKFPDGDALHRWHDSDVYQALVPLRREAADMIFIVAEEPPQ